MKPSASETAVILIVDDTPANLSMLFDLLSEMNYTVLVAEDGASALQQVQLRRPDLILLDIIMTGMDGYSVCHALKADPTTRDIPVIFMSALSESENKINGFELGAVDYITKPFRNDEVLARLRTHLGIQQLQQQLQASEKRLSQIIAGSKDAIVTVDQEGKISLFNLAAEQMFLCRAKNLHEKDFKSLFSPALTKFFNSYRNTTNATPHPIWIPEGHYAKRHNGEAFEIEASLSCISSNTGTYYTFILRDVEERRKAAAETRQLRQLNQYLLEQEKYSGIEGMIGSSTEMRALTRAINHVAPTDATVLITGETGTGKELVANAIHNLSARKQQPMIKLNCAAIPENLVESELFGHEKGAFTGALARKIGRFELANQGTLFLDEIGEMPADIQAKLLRILQEGEFERLGSSQTITVDVRIIAATHRDLPQTVAAGRFREDLFYRLNVFPVPIPALRERITDIPELARHFLQHYASKFNKPVNAIPKALLQMLKNYHWPGNIRELQHLIERAVILSSGTELVFGDWLQPLSNTLPDEPPQTLEEVEFNHISRVLEQTRWRISGKNGAAEVLGINASTLRSRMAKLGISRHT